MRTILFSCLLLITFASFAFADDKQNSKAWYGVMDIGVREFRFRIEPIPNATEASAYQLVSLDEGQQVFKLDRFELDDSKLAFELKVTKASYTGEVSEQGLLSKGKWKQSGAEFDLIFKRNDPASETKPEEVWSGTLNILLQKLTLRLRVYRNADGSEKCFVDSVSQRAGGFKAKRVIEGNDWKIDIVGLQSTFKGTMNGDKSEVKGNWLQGGQSIGLTFKPEKGLVEVPIAGPKRPQTPKSPFPYQVEEVSFINTMDGVQLAGTLTLPKTEKPCSAVILISGSGPQDRDETILDHKPFWVLADHLAKKGIAVLRFDDRGTSKSTGDFSKATSEDFAKDVESAFEFLSKDSRIAKNKIGLMGHSEGGLIAPMVASKRSDVAFVILLAGTGVNGKEIILSQGELILKAEGVQETSALKMQRNTQLAIIDAVLDSPKDSSKDTIVEKAMANMSSHLSKEEFNEPKLKPAIAAGVEQMNSPWFRFFLTYEPRISLSKVTCPLLALNGQKDTQVDPRLNLPAIKSSLEQSGNRSFELVELPNLNHLFQTCTTGGLSEYQSIEETFAPIALDKISEWLKSNAF